MSYFTGLLNRFKDPNYFPTHATNVRRIMTEALGYSNCTEVALDKFKLINNELKGSFYIKFRAVECDEDGRGMDHDCIFKFKAGVPHEAELQISDMSFDIVYPTKKMMADMQTLIAIISRSPDYRNQTREIIKTLALYQQA